MEERLAYIAALCEYSKSNEYAILKKEARSFIEMFLDRFREGPDYESPEEDLLISIRHEYFFNNNQYILMEGMSRTHFRHFTFNIKHSHVKFNLTLPFYANMILILRYYFNLKTEDEDMILRQCFKAFFKEKKYPLNKKLKFFYIPF